MPTTDMRERRDLRPMPKKLRTSHLPLNKVRQKTAFFFRQDVWATHTTKIWAVVMLEYMIGPLSR